jgi:hypothetical protein
MIHCDALPELLVLDRTLAIFTWSCAFMFVALLSSRAETGAVPQVPIITIPGDQLLCVKQVLAA